MSLIMISFQAKGIQHCRDIKKDALTYWYLFGGNEKDMKTCIKLALEDHVKLLQEEASMISISKNNEAVPATDSGQEDPY